MQTIPRPEYPRPQMVRENWRNLNGEWQFCLDQGQSGRERGLHEAASLPGSILVPFCPESKLSGIGHTDFISCVWYKRNLTLPADWTKPGHKTLLHIGACDYATQVWVNGQSVGTHTGRLHFLLLRHHRRPEARRKPNHHLRHGHAAHAGTALRQAEPRLPFLRLLLYAHHGHLADRLAGKRTRSLHRQAQVYAGH